MIDNKIALENKQNKLCYLTLHVCVLFQEEFHMQSPGFTKYRSDSPPNRQGP